MGRQSFTCFCKKDRVLMASLSKKRRTPETSDNIDDNGTNGTQPPKKKQRVDEGHALELRNSLKQKKERLNRLETEKQKEIDKINAKYDPVISEISEEIKDLNGDIQRAEKNPCTLKCISCNETLKTDYMDKE